MEQLLGPVRPENKKLFTTRSFFEIGPIGIYPFPIPHDAVEPVGFSFFCNAKKVTVATDIGHVNADLLKNLEGSGLVLLESNHDLAMLQNGSYPYYLKRRILSDNGHLSNKAAGEAAVCLATRGISHLILGHLSKENNHPELAYQCVAEALTDTGLKIGRDIRLSVAHRDKTGEAVCI